MNYVRRMRTRRQFLRSATLITSFALGPIKAHAQVASSPSKIYELRLYTANPGKLPEFQSLFRQQALPLFAKYGIENVFDGTVLEGARVDGSDAHNMLVCILAHQDHAAADRSWAVFEGDAGWRAALERAQQNGPLLAKPAASIYMDLTDFSPALEPPAERSKTRVFELRKYNTGPDGLARTVDQFKSGIATILSKNGMTPIAYWTAEDRSAFIYLLAHKDRGAARASWASFMTDFRPFIAEFNARSPAPPSGNRKPDDNRFLLPTDYSPRK